MFHIFHLSRICESVVSVAMYLGGLKAGLKIVNTRVVINVKESAWKNVVSGVPQGSVQGPTLFQIYTDDTDGVFRKISTSANDIQTGNRANTPQQRILIQRDIDKLLNWGQKWQEDSNTDKCRVVNTGCKNEKQLYSHIA